MQDYLEFFLGWNLIAVKENGCSDSTSPISEPPDITNWFSSYVYESLPLCSSINESEKDVNLGGTVSNKDHKSIDKSMKEVSDRNLYESLPSEPPNIGNWFSSYVYESPMLDTSDGLELSVPGEIECLEDKETEKESPKTERNDVFHKLDKQELVSSTKISDRSLYESLPSEPPNIGNRFSSYVYESPMLDTSDGLEFPGEIECVKDKETEKETPRTKRNYVFHKLDEQELVSSSTKVTDFSQSQSVLSEPPDVRNWFSSYEYQSPQLSDTHELGFSSFGKEELIIDESDAEEENTRYIFRKTNSNQKPIAHDRLESNNCKDDVAAVGTAKEIFADNAYLGQEMNEELSAELLNASKKELKQESSFKQKPLFCKPKEAKFNPGAPCCNQERRSPLKNEASLHELGPNNIQETISMNSKRQNSPIDQESNDKENVPGQSTEIGFVTTKKARFREARDRCSMNKPNTEVLVECSRSKRWKNFAREEDKEERRNKKRRVLEEISNHQSSGAEEIPGKWSCPQKNKKNIVPPLKQLRLDVWVHKV